jgi:hypothetical protein
MLEWQVTACEDPGGSAGDAFGTWAVPSQIHIQTG